MGPLTILILANREADLEDRGLRAAKCLPGLEYCDNLDAGRVEYCQ
jgi:hypothetical protein